MAFDITKTVQDEEVPFKRPSPEFFKAVGGAEGMQKLMYSFYDIIYESDIQNFFPQDRVEFDKVKVKNTKFFVQLCGGPKVYEAESGGMDLDEFMIRVHDDFTIDDAARMEWLGCMQQALSNYEMDEAIKQDFWDYAEAFSKLTVNKFKDLQAFNPYH
jgi:hemoglobin